MIGQNISVRVTFVSTKRGSTPRIYIELPINITTHVGDIGIKQFEEFKRRICILVEEKEYGLYFHKDSANKYEFDESSLPNGGIYGLKQMREIEDGNKKITEKGLTPIKTQTDFEKNVRSSAIKLYKRRGGETV